MKQTQMSLSCRHMSLLLFADLAHVGLKFWNSSLDSVAEVLRHFMFASPL